MPAAVGLEGWDLSAPAGTPGEHSRLVAAPAVNVPNWGWPGLTDIHRVGRGPGKDVQNGARGEEEASSSPVVHVGVQGRDRGVVPAWGPVDRPGGGGLRPDRDGGAGVGQAGGHRRRPPVGWDHDGGAGGAQPAAPGEPAAGRGRRDPQAGNGFLRQGSAKTRPISLRSTASWRAATMVASSPRSRSAGRPAAPCTHGGAEPGGAFPSRAGPLAVPDERPVPVPAVYDYAQDHGIDAVREEELVWFTDGLDDKGQLRVERRKAIPAPRLIDLRTQIRTMSAPEGVPSSRGNPTPAG